jgi:predicted DNA-binding transcriptional regulator AlpA
VTQPQKQKAFEALAALPPELQKAFAALAALPPTLPDFTVLTKAQASAVTQISEDTLDRLHRQNLGPKRVQLSARRIGYQVGELRRWLEERSTARKSRPARSRHGGFIQ